MENVTPTSDEPWIPTKHEFLRDTMAPLFLSCASFLTTPGCLGSSMILRMISPTNQLGKYDFCTTKTREFALRALFAAFLLPMAISGLTAGSQGLFVRLMGNIFQKNAYSYAQGNAPEKKFTNSATVLTWNICGMAGGLSRPFGGMLEWSKRIDGIAQKILKEDADVVCLQEVLDAELAEQLKEKFKEKYKHIYYHIGGSSYRMGSGLFVASKLPIGNFTFTPFATGGSGQFKMHYKGFISGTFEGSKLQFIATHTCAGSPQASADIRIKQIQQMIDFAQKKPTIFVGDFNVNRSSTEWEKSPLKNLKRDTNFDSMTATDADKYKMFDNDFSKAPEEKLDDILTNRDVDIKANLVDREGLSDHHAVFATVTV